MINSWLRHERIQIAVRWTRTPFAIGDERLQVTTSVGVVTGSAADGMPELLRAADEALYRAKAAGRNRVVAAELVLK